LQRVNNENRTEDEDILKRNLELHVLNAGYLSRSQKSLSKVAFCSLKINISALWTLIWRCGTRNKTEEKQIAVYYHTLYLKEVMKQKL